MSQRQDSPTSTLRGKSSWFRSGFAAYQY